MSSRSFTPSLVALLALVAAACGEQSLPLGPAFEPDVPPLLSKGNGKLAPLAFASSRAGESASAECGTEGCTISAANVTLSVPAGALSSTVEITVTVPPGRFVEASFAPHGLTFEEDVAISFAFGGALPATAAAIATAKVAEKLLEGLQAVYFTGTLGESAEALEILEVTVVDHVATFHTNHFSRYCLATN